MSDWTVTRGSLTIGAGTDYVLTGPVGGLGTPGVRASDADRGNRDGSVGGTDPLERRTISIPIGMWASTTSGAVALLDTVKAAFAPSTSDVTITIELPGMGPWTFYGRPRGIDVDLANLSEGWIATLIQFVALDPVAYDDPVTVTAGTSIVATNSGTWPTDRCTLTVIAAGGIPVIANSTGGSIVWAEAFTGTRIVDLRTRTVVDDSAIDRTGEIAPSSQWMTLAVGTNTISVTNATSVAASFRPGNL